MVRGLKYFGIGKMGRGDSASNERAAIVVAKYFDVKSK